MLTLRALGALGSIDRISVGRDPLLRWILVLAPASALVVRWIFPPLLARVEEATGVDLAPHVPALVGYVLLLLVPNLVGMVVGFLLLDQRDDDTLAALRVTPVPLAGYLAYRLAGPVLLTIAVTLALFPIAGLMDVGPAALLASTLAAAPLAPLFALFLAAFAANKVQGFALTKATGVLLIAPLVAYFVESGWRWALGVVPTFWPAVTYWAFREAEGSAWAYLGIGIAYQLLLLLLLLRRFRRVTSR
ncbi:MAG TPA: hypothetical protein VGR37_09450 [Longimicrobiaceae bacterium]|nr:hypothetical protein [Longimicrobiaceae bacterium]